ncbi:hypothetical protein SLA2020_477320 [Shorea laevis]
MTFSLYHILLILLCSSGFCSASGRLLFVQFGPTFPVSDSSQTPLVDDAKVAKLPYLANFTQMFPFPGLPSLPSFPPFPFVPTMPSVPQLPLGPGFQDPPSLVIGNPINP